MKVHRSRSVRGVKVAGDGRNLTSRGGTVLLAELADRSGLTRALSVAMTDCGISWHTHDPGVVLTHLAVAVADGADCLADFAGFGHPQEQLFGPVASVPTAWRTLNATTSTELRVIPAAVAAARAKVWAAAPVRLGSLILDFDATLVTSYSDKQDAAATYKRGFGFHPLGVWCDTTNEPLAAILRPGNAGSNDTDDHLELLDQALAGLPAEFQGGHQIGDRPAEVVHPILVRADSAGATHGFVRGLLEANCDYSIGYPIDGRVRDALLFTQEEHWEPAINTNGTPRHGAEVVELTELYDLKAWGPGTRLICRRERPHPGAQLSLFDIHDGWRHTCFITNTANGDITNLELRHRQHARVEDRVRCWKDCGLANLPFEDYVRNQAWVTVSLIAGALLAWSQLICFDGDLARAEPKTLRHRILHVAAVLAHRGHDLILRFDQNWPWTPNILTAFNRLRTAIP